MVTNFKKNIKQSAWSNVLLHLCGITIIAALVFLTITDVNIYQKRSEFTAQVSNLKSQVKSVKQSNETLRQGIENANNVASMEKIAREDLDLQKPGEQVVSFIVPPASQMPTTAKKKNLLQSWWQWIRGEI